MGLFLAPRSMRLAGKRDILATERAFSKRFTNFTKNFSGKPSPQRYFRKQRCFFSPCFKASSSVLMWRTRFFGRRGHQGSCTDLEVVEEM